MIGDLNAELDRTDEVEFWIRTFPADEETAASYAASRPRSAAERNAYAMFAKAPLASSYDPRWNVWAAVYGGSQTTDGNTAAGSNATTSRLFGTAVGLDYRFSPFTTAGFALAGGGTNFSVTGGGSGRSDLFQAGAFVRHTSGAAYLSGALAYGWQENAVLTLRGRAAWAHDFNPDRAIGATFQALPGASFVVNCARQASDSALATASAEMKWLNGWSAAATFEGEFSNVTRSYAGNGALRYAW